jgi:hypothetical protein
MLCSYPVACPRVNCAWTGSLVPSVLRGGADAEIASMHRGWFHCARCQTDWEVRIIDDRVTVLPAVDSGNALQHSVSSKSARAVAFDLDPASLASLREALPGWKIDNINGATPASLAHNWDPGTADLLIVSARDNATETLGLCRFLSSFTGHSTEALEEGAKTPGGGRKLPALRPDAPLLVLVPSAHEPLVRGALDAGAHSCLMLPIHAKEVAGMLVHARAGNQPGRHTLHLEGAQTEDRWRDDGGQG